MSAEFDADPFETRQPFTRRRLSAADADPSALLSPPCSGQRGVPEFLQHMMFTSCWFMRTWQPWPAASGQKQRHTRGAQLLSQAVTNGDIRRSNQAPGRHPAEAHGTASCAGSRGARRHPCSHTALRCSAQVGNLCNVLPLCNAQRDRERSSQAASGAPSARVHSAGSRHARQPTLQPDQAISQSSRHQMEVTMCSLATVPSPAKSQGHK